VLFAGKSCREINLKVLADIEPLKNEPLDCDNVFLKGVRFEQSVTLRMKLNPLL